MANESAQKLARLGKGKPKTMTSAAYLQRIMAARASAKARKERTKNNLEKSL